MPKLTTRKVTLTGDVVLGFQRNARRKGHKRTFQFFTPLYIDVQGMQRQRHRLIEKQLLFLLQSCIHQKTTVLKFLQFDRPRTACLNLICSTPNVT